MFGRRRRDLVCIEFVEVVTEYLDGAMPLAERTRFEAHLAACGSCARYLEQIRTTIELAGRLTVDDVDALGADARSELLAAFRAYHGSS
jgi:anti-sigma factor RsiW